MPLADLYLYQHKENVMDETVCTLKAEKEKIDCELKIDGHFDCRWRHWFRDLRFELNTENGRAYTIIRGHVPPSSLFGILQLVYATGHRLVYVNGHTKK